MQRARKTLSIALCLVLILALIAGCDNTKNQTGTTPENGQSGTTKASGGNEKIEYDADSTLGGLTLPLTDKGEVYTYLGLAYAGADLSKWTVWSDLKEKTGITINAESTSGSADKIKLLIATNNMPDIFYNNYTYGATQIDKLGMQGVLLPLDEYFDYMPNFRNLLEENPELKKSLTSSDGHIYSTPLLGIAPPYDYQNGMWYRADVFETYDITPKWDTKDDFYNTLLALKQKTPDYYPMITERADWGFYYTWMLMFGTGNEAGMYYQDMEDKWNYSFIEDNFKEMLMFIYKLQSDGLLDPEWLTNGATMFWNVFGKTPYEGGAVAIENTSWVGPKGNIQWKDYDTKGVMELKFLPPFDTGLKNARRAYPQGNMATNGLLISANVKNPELLAQMIDYCYSTEGQWLTVFGKEGVDYNLVNGMPVPIGGDGSGTITDLASTVFTTGHWLTIGMAFRVPTAVYKPPYIRQEMSDLQNYMKENNMGVTRDTRMLFSDIRNDFVITKQASINTYALAEVNKFVTGARDFSEWDTFVNEVKAMGVQDLMDVFNAQWEEQKNN
jgi:putative aldouronate transport system substrate-binding protein